MAFFQIKKGFVSLNLHYLKKKKKSTDIFRLFKTKFLEVAFYFETRFSEV